MREHAFLLASHSIQYSFVRIKGLANMLHGGNGMFMDRFVTAQYPGLLMLHGNGNVLERTLRPGEKILVEPGGFLYKDSSVTMQTTQMPAEDRDARPPQHVPGRDDRPRPGRHPVHVRPPRLRRIAGRADEHLRLPVLPAAERPERSRPARCAARRSTSGTASATPAGSSSRRSGTWRSCSSASRTSRSRAPRSRSPSSTSRSRRWSTSRTTCCSGPTRRPGCRTCPCAAAGSG